MTNEKYDKLLAEIRTAKHEADAYRALAAAWDARLDRLLKELDREEHRLAQQGLPHLPIASRKLVVGE